jgi:hypothetical protein
MRVLFCLTPRCSHHAEPQPEISPIAQEIPQIVGRRLPDRLEVGVGALIAVALIADRERELLLISTNRLSFEAPRSGSDMRYFYLLSCAALLFGCASGRPLPVAAAPPAPANSNTGVEVRHMYLFEPGKKPMLIVDRQNEPSTAQEVSAEPPSVR